MKNKHSHSPGDVGLCSYRLFRGQMTNSKRFLLVFFLLFQAQTTICSIDDLNKCPEDCGEGRYKLNECEIDVTTTVSPTTSAPNVTESPTSAVTDSTSDPVNVTETKLQDYVPVKYCENCTQNCKFCNITDELQGTVSCHECYDGFKVFNNTQCTKIIPPEKSSSTDNVPIIVGVICGLIFIAVVAVLIGIIVKRKYFRNEPVSGQCQVKAYLSDELQGTKPSSPRTQNPITDEISDSDELVKLGKAPPPPGYDGLGIPVDEDLSYTGLQFPTPGDAVYQNTAFYQNEANNHQANMPTASSHPTTGTGERNQPEADEVYVNELGPSEYGNLPGPGQTTRNDHQIKEASPALEMDEIYINGPGDDIQKSNKNVQPKSPLKPVVTPRHQASAGQPIMGQQDMYETAEGGMPLRQSDIYENTGHESLYQNLQRS